MSSKYPILPPKKIIKAMKKLGFYKISQGTLKSILEQAEIELEQFLNNL